ncbi:UNVERIFIED_CONTAM: putative mitochondrial protein [Sesamum latifolium]|uniref:Mitochondrial protein n=1 Tax=Sesamum latifolium TaxID=2727402 RepID=A0AAW2YBR3_9LAMI
MLHCPLFRIGLCFQSPWRYDIARGTEHLCHVVDDGMREDLVQPYTEAEVTWALSQMVSFKSSGPDGSLITDNIILTFELNHFLNTKTTGKQGFMTLKLDVNKAYDKIEWTFLEQGLRQGDPLSPYLFILCTESFSSLLRKAESDGYIQGVAICRPFSRSTSTTTRSQIASDFGIRVENRMEFYLGLPSVVARSKRDLFFVIKDHKWDRISGYDLQVLVEQLGLIQDSLGFLSTFVLAKQLWRIICLQEKLLCRVLKARHFPNGDIFSTTLGHCSSFTWRSFMSAQELFWDGCRWRVGSGSSICIWSNP